MLSLISKKEAGFKQSFLSWALTVGLLAGVYFLLQSMSVPTAVAEKQEMLEFLPLDIVNIQAFKKMDTASEPEPRVQTIEAEVANSNSVPKIEVENDLMKLFESSVSKEMIKPDLPVSRQDVDAAIPEIEMNIQQSRLSTEFSPTNSFSKESYQIPRFEKNQSGNVSDINVEIGQTSELKISNTGKVVQTKPRTTIDSKKPVSPDVEVPIKNASQLGDDYENLSPIYKELIEWMKKNPRDLSSVTKRFMGYRKGDLTSGDEIKLSGRFFELFLICHEKQFEVRICLVERDQATLLIDKGFRKQSNYFRVGNASRDPKNHIFSYGTSQESASDQRTDEFYRIFLTWWEQVNRDKQ